MNQIPAWKRERVRSAPFLTAPRRSGYSYVRVPRSMLSLGGQLGISADETLLYSLLRDRVRLSQENDWQEDGRYYICFTRSEVSRITGWSKKKTVAVFRDLVRHNLLEESDRHARNGVFLRKRLFLNLWAEPVRSGADISLEDLRQMRFPPCTPETLDAREDAAYYVLPVMMLTGELYSDLSQRAVLLYAMIHDRLSLSAQYRRAERDGRVWTVLDQEQALAELGCSRSSLTRAYAELLSLGLIERRIVVGEPHWRIYVRDFLLPLDPPEPEKEPEKEPDAAPSPAETGGRENPAPARAPVPGAQTTPAAPAGIPLPAGTAPETAALLELLAGREETGLPALLRTLPSERQPLVSTLLVSGLNVLTALCGLLVQPGNADGLQGLSGVETRGSVPSPAPAAPAPVPVRGTAGAPVPSAPPAGRREVLFGVSGTTPPGARPGQTGTVAGGQMRQKETPEGSEMHRSQIRMSQKEPSNLQKSPSPGMPAGAEGTPDLGGQKLRQDLHREAFRMLQTESVQILLEREANGNDEYLEHLLQLLNLSEDILVRDLSWSGTAIPISRNLLLTRAEVLERICQATPQDIALTLIKVARQQSQGTVRSLTDYLHRSLVLSHEKHARESALQRSQIA